MSFLMGNIIDLVGESNAELTAQFKQFQKQLSSSKLFHFENDNLYFSTISY